MMTFKLNIMGQVQRLERLDGQNVDEYWRGMQRQAIKRANDGDLDYLPIKGTKEFGTSSPTTWDFTKTTGVAPTRHYHTEFMGKRT
jgi:hypothetical protein